MKNSIKLLLSYLSAMILSLIISSVSFAQDNEITKKEKDELEGLYTVILGMEFCSKLNLFFDYNVVEDAKRKSKEKIKNFVITDGEKNQIWMDTEKEVKDMLFVIGLADYSKKYEFCSGWQSFYQIAFIDMNINDQKSSEKPF